MFIPRDAELIKVTGSIVSIASVYGTGLEDEQLCDDPQLIVTSSNDVKSPTNVERWKDGILGPLVFHLVEK